MNNLLDALEKGVSFVFCVVDYLDELVLSNYGFIYVILSLERPLNAMNEGI